MIIKNSELKQLKSGICPCHFALIVRGRNENNLF